MAMTLFAGAYDAGADKSASATSYVPREHGAVSAVLRISRVRRSGEGRRGTSEAVADHLHRQVKAPLLIFQGVNDPRVPVGEALQIHDALEAKRSRTELMMFPDEGHGAQARERGAYAGPQLAFFEQQLK